jgi:predicted transcriptional regulator
MARPRTYEERRVATAVRLPESIYRRLHDAASDRDVSANLLVTRAVSEFLDRLPSADASIGGTGQRRGRGRDAARGGDS